MKTYNQEDVDQWVQENNDNDAYLLLAEEMPKMHGRLDQLAKRMNKLLEEVKEVFPDAQYYTGSGGFLLTLGNTHDGGMAKAQQQRVAWSGSSIVSVGDGDW